MQGQLSPFIPPVSSVHFEAGGGYNPFAGTARTHPSPATPGGGAGAQETTLAQPIPVPSIPPNSSYSTNFAPTSSDISTSLFDTLLRPIYSCLLLTLPSLYVSRIQEIFEAVEKSKSDISHSGNGFHTLLIPDAKSPAIDSLIKSWEYLIGSLVREWETLNIVSVLLSSAILTTLQIDGAATDPYSRYFALQALMCSLMSLLYGCIYIIRFNTMRRSRRIVEWAKQAQKTRTSIWWNVRILLAMPGIWFSWSFIFYLICVMTFLWRSGTTSDTVLQLTPRTALGPRIVITFTLVLGLVSLCFVVLEFRRYGYVMDKDRKMNSPMNPQIDPLNQWQLPISPPPRPFSVNTTSVDEFKDLECTIHEVLSYIPSEPRVIYELHFPPDEQSISFPMLGRPYDHIDVVQLATDPPVHHMRLFHPLLPTYIDVYKESHENGVTIRDVITNMYWELQSPQYQLDERLGNERKERIVRAFEIRTRGSNKSEMIKIVDYLEDKMVFVGLVRNEDGLWEMKTVE